MAAEVHADYLGGHPDGHLSPLAGKLIASEGALRFEGTTVSAGLQTQKVSLEIPADQLRAITVGEPNHMRTLTRAFVGEVIGGAVGALIGAVTGKRNYVLVAACEREAFPFAVSFAVERSEGAWLLAAMQTRRKDRGEKPIPRVEDIAGERALDESERQTALLTEIRDLLREQTALLRQSARPM
jgi:hypothetical protein